MSEIISTKSKVQIWRERIEGQASSGKRVGFFCEEHAITVFALWYKRLEKERFRWPKNHDDEVIRGSAEQLEKLFFGFDVFQKPHLFLKYDRIG